MGKLQVTKRRHIRPDEGVGWETQICRGNQDVKSGKVPWRGGVGLSHKHSEMGISVTGEVCVNRCVEVGTVYLKDSRKG